MDLGVAGGGAVGGVNGAYGDKCGRWMLEDGGCSKYIFIVKRPRGHALPRRYEYSPQTKQTRTHRIRGSDILPTSPSLGSKARMYCRFPTGSEPHFPSLGSEVTLGSESDPRLGFLQ